MRSARICTFLALLCIAAVAISGTAEAKSAYLVANHWYQNFDAWNINPDGTLTFQSTNPLSCTTDPSGIGVYEWFGPDQLWDTADDELALFITSEFAAGFAVVDKHLNVVGCVTSGLPSDLAGCDVTLPDPATGDAHVFAMSRGTNDLYVFDWDASTQTATNRPGSPIQLPSCSGGVGISLDTITDILYVADTFGGYVRGYSLDLTAMTATQVMTYNPAEGPVDVEVDAARGLLYTAAPDGYCAWGASGGTGLLCKYDLNTGIETTHDTGSSGIMGIAVNETTGYVYLTHGCYGDMVTVWDTSTSPFTFLQNTGSLGNPAGIAIGKRIGGGLLNLSKNDGLPDDACVPAGSQITYDICFDNQNGYDVAGVVLTDDLPAEVSFVSATGGGVYDGGTHTITWDVGALPDGTSQCYQVVVQVDPAAAPLSMITNYATIDSNLTPVETDDEQTQVCEPPPCDIMVPDDYSTIQAAIEAAQDGDIICVRDGVYKGPGNQKIYFRGKAITLRSENGPANCIIDLQGASKGFHFYRGEDAGTVLDGFTIMNGFTTSWGGAIWVQNSSPTISNCVILNCVANYYGGAIWLYNASPTIMDCTLGYNYAGRYGGGICSWVGSKPVIDGCTIRYNGAGVDGGGIFHLKSTPTIVDCTVEDNVPNDISGR